MVTKKRVRKLKTEPVSVTSSYTIDNVELPVGETIHATMVTAGEAKVLQDNEKLSRQRHAKEILWKVAKSVMIAGSAALITFVLQQLELKAAQEHPEAMQAVLSVVVAMLKAIISALTKL